MNLVPIGRFSEMTRLSVKALRLYDEKGLLRPAHVDPSSGYRYYDIEQASRAELVKTLRTVNMPLEQIQEIFEADNNEIAHKQLLAHRKRLRERLAAQERTLTYLETLIDHEEGIVVSPSRNYRRSSTEGCCHEDAHLQRPHRRRHRHRVWGIDAGDGPQWCHGRGLSTDHISRCDR